VADTAATLFDSYHVWLGSGGLPAIIPYSIEGIESAAFLSPEQKRAILCGNAARFLRLDPKLCEGGVQ